MTAVVGRRQAIVDALAECRVGAWVAIDELSRHMRATGNTFEVTRDPWNLYISEMQYGSLGYEGSHGWDLLQERFIMALLFEYAATLGLVDVAYSTPDDARSDFRSLWGTDDLRFLSRYDGLSCVRLTGLGGLCLDIVDNHAPTFTVSASRVSVLPTLDIVADRGQFDPGDNTFLSTFCVRRGEGFVLDRATALAAIEKGHRASDLAQFLEEACGEALPDSARAFLEDLARRAATLSVVGHALLIECADPELASLLGKGAKTKHLCTLVDNGTIMVPAESEAAFRRAVKAIGYPVLARANGRD